MMRFRCPHCQNILEVVQLTETFLCPSCELWCRIPIPDEFELRHEEAREVAPPRSSLLDEPRLAPSDPLPVPRRDAVTAPRIEPLPIRLREEPDEVEEVKFEVIEDGAEQRRKRRRKRRRRSAGSGLDLDYWISPSLILLFLLVPAGLFLVVVAFFLHPGAGFGALLMVAGGIWFTFIAAEDGMVTALLVLFVPFYAWYFTFTNFDRVAVPFVVQNLGAIIFTVSLIATGMREAETSSAPPAPIVCGLAG